MSSETSKKVVRSAAVSVIGVVEPPAVA
jgi:hypothetical protein